MTPTRARALVGELDHEQLELVAESLELDATSADVALVTALLGGLRWAVVLVLLDDGEPCDA